MRLSPRELDKLILSQSGFLAQRRLARGLKLNLPEATALIASQLQERIRDGKHSVSELMQLGKEMLGRRHVLPGVSALMHDVQVEGTFPDGCACLTPSMILTIFIPIAFLACFSSRFTIPSATIILI